MDLTQPAQSNTRHFTQRVLSATLTVAMLPAMALAEHPHELQLASDIWPPFTDATDRHGVAVELVHTALERAGIEATTTIVDWKDVETGIRQAKFDGCAAMWQTEKRARELLFSQPYLENRLVLVGRRGSDVSAATMSDLAGQKVAAVGRYAYGQEVDSAVGVHFVNSRNDQDSLDKLLAGEVDYMLVDELVVRYLLTHQQEEAAAKLEIGNRSLGRRKLHFALRRDVPGAKEIIDAFNSEIRGMLADGTYAGILQVDWIRADVDGDGLDELVTLGESIGQVPPSRVYDVFGEVPETEPEKERIFVAGSIYEGWDAVPEEYKRQTIPNEQRMKQGTTVFTLKF
jgi:polar amino acid transport system substrate-binding protein